MNEPRPEASYLSRLFQLQTNWILYGGALLFALASASYMPALVGTAVEAVVLLVGSSLPPVRRFLDSRDVARRRAEANAQLMVAVRGLERDYATRVMAVDHALGEIRDFGGPRPGADFERAVTGLETLRGIHLALCETHQRVGRFLAATPPKELLAEVDRLKATFTAEKDIGLRLTLRQAVTLAQRRVEHREGLAQTQRGVGVRLESLERSLAYLRSQGETLAQSPRFPTDVDTLVSQIDPPITVDLEAPEVGRLSSNPAAPSFG